MLLKKLSNYHLFLNLNEIKIPLQNKHKFKKLTLINPKLQGISYWHDLIEGIIFVFTADQYEGELTHNSPEGELEWIDIDELPNINQFDQNLKFTPYLFKDEMFEGKFLLDDKCKVLKYEIRKI